MAKQTSDQRDRSRKEGLSVGPATAGGGNNNDDGWETDEEQLVQVELSGFFQEDLRNNLAAGHAKFVGLDTDQPIVQLGNQIFAGKYTETVGTSVFFKASDQEEAAAGDPVFSNKSSEPLEFLCQTDRKLQLKRVFLSKRD